MPCSRTSQKNISSFLNSRKEAHRSMKQRTYIAIDLKSFYASMECRERGLDPMDTNLVVADESRTLRSRLPSNPTVSPGAEGSLKPSSGSRKPTLEDGTTHRDEGLRVSLIFSPNCKQIRSLRSTSSSLSLVWLITWNTARGSTRSI